MDETLGFPDTPIARMQYQVKELGQPVTQAAAQVYGSVKRYYANTTPDERKTVYCRPCRASFNTCQLNVEINPDILARFVTLCQQRNVTQARMVRRLILKELALETGKR